MQLLDGVQVRLPRHVPTFPDLIDRRAVKDELIRPAQQAVSVHHAAHAVPVSGPHHSWNGLQQILIAASEARQLLDPLPLQDVPQRGTIHLQRRCHVQHLDLGRRLRNLHHHIHRRVLLRKHGQGAFEPLHPGHFHHQPVRSRDDAGHHVETGFIGHGLAGDGGRGVG